MKIKPLIRYTIGKVSKSGWTILSESVRSMKKIYPEFDIVICHNKLLSHQVSKLNDMGVDLLDQDFIDPPFKFIDDDRGRVVNFCWKLMPPRIRPETHELWVDNDIIIRGRIKAIDDWLTKNTAIISKGFNKDYGVFKKHPLLIKQDAYCAGFFGLPPNFDFLQSIKDLCADKPLEGFDEQGLVSLIVAGFEDKIVLSHRDMVLLSETWKPKPDFWFPQGLHFARANRFDNHVSWNIYKTAIMP